MLLGEEGHVRAGVSEQATMMLALIDGLHLTLLTVPGDRMVYLDCDIRRP
ncbi:hypothetical protein QM797_02920 [Rhodococcus sp. IEGM 1381]|nr:hypothetical protein [Rhodococcus sp. IEGM 1381]MDI9893666.1 hypothetical protein [Rhodococcus sp. IEGM 1381]